MDTILCSITEEALSQSYGRKLEQLNVLVLREGLSYVEGVQVDVYIFCNSLFLSHDSMHSMFMT